MKVAILIPTMNRIEFIERTLSYYNSLNSQHPVYIGDASSSDVSDEILELIKHFENVDVRYFHWEKLCTSKTIVKLAEAANLECEFCAFQGDDDYLIPSSLTQCAQFLRNNKHYRTAQGRGAVFILDKKGPYGNIKILGDYWGKNALEQDTRLGRFECFEKKYFVQQFSVHRTKEFLEDSILFSDTKQNSISELLHCYTFAIKGKSKYIDCLYLVRNEHDGRGSIDFVEWVSQDNWSKDYNNTVDELSKLLSETNEITYDLANEKVRKALRKHIIPKQKSNAGFKVFLPGNLKYYVLVALNYFKNSSDLRLLTSKRSLFYKHFLFVQKSLKK